MVEKEKFAELNGDCGKKGEEEDVGLRHSSRFNDQVPVFAFAFRDGSDLRMIG